MIQPVRRVPTINNKREALKLAKAALEAEANEFASLAEEITSLMSKEVGKIGKMRVKGKLATIEPRGEAVIVGDIHGDLESLVHILIDSRFIEKAEQQEDVMIIFLGDYGDRGPNSTEVYYVVLKLKQRLPENVVLMRGNHEGPEGLLAYPHDLPVQFEQRFGEGGNIVYSSIRKLFNQLYNAVLVQNRFILIHGGFPVHSRSIDDLAYANEIYPKETFLEEMLWNDPEEVISSAVPSPRGAGNLFGESVTTACLKMLKVNALIRGHEPCPEGFKLNHDSKILTLFSRKGEPYCNEHGAYLRLSLSLKPKNAEELLPWICQF